MRRELDERNVEPRHGGPDVADPKIHETTDPFACSFCGKSRTEVAKLCADRAACICDECVALCCAVLAEQLPGDKRFAMMVPLRIASDTADSLNRWAAAMFDETTPEPPARGSAQLRRRSARPARARQPRAGARVQDRKSTHLNSSHLKLSRMPSSA